MKSEFCVHFTRRYIRGQLSGLTPRSSLAFSTIHAARAWLAQATQNRQLDYVIEDPEITEKFVSSETYHLSSWADLNLETEAGAKCAGEPPSLPKKGSSAGPRPRFSEDDHEARYCGLE